MNYLKINAITFLITSLVACGGSNTSTSTPTPTSTYSLSMHTFGNGILTSNVTSSCSGNNVLCSSLITQNSRLSLVATPSSGYTFLKWGCDCSNSVSSTYLINMNAAKNVTAVFSSNADLCNGLITDKLAHPMTSLSKPSLGSTVIDPQFGTTIRRISNAGNAGSFIVPAYSTISAWNADESYLILYHTGTNPAYGAGHHLYNGKTYAHIKTLTIDPSDLEQFYWDTIDPAILYYANSSDRKFYKYNVNTDVATALHDFSTPPTNCTSNDGLSGGTDPMFMSWDSKKNRLDVWN